MLRDAGKRKHSVFARIKMHKIRYLMLLPGIVLVFVFNYLPLAGWSMAFVNYKLGFGVLRSDWAGLKHFIYFFKDTSEALFVVRNTLVINISSLVINLVFGCVLAILLNEVRIGWFKRLTQTSSFFPFFISFVIVYSIFNSFLSVNNGLVNQILVKSNIISDGINFLGDEKYAWPLILVVNLWKGLGYNCVIFLASISSIDVEQYQSAEIDGAGRFLKIRYITLPGLASTFIILLIMNSGWIFSSNFEQFYLFTNPTNMPTMQVFDYYIYAYGLKSLNVSYATAVGIIKSFISVLLLYSVNRLAGRLSKNSLF